ncbi:uncharacterized protein LOC134234892 [Saccostrea cucullata]|uniref:uncharacterized protein LOC134234892 n=1 Tax=Saccostrea cuccullata TaxID=36930 RepID=UPI002ED3C0A8
MRYLHLPASPSPPPLSRKLKGEHESCGQWCHAADEGYKPKKLPYGKPLTDPNLKEALGDLMTKYALKSANLSKLGSSQANESFNQMVSTKAPKRFLIKGRNSDIIQIAAKCGDSSFDTYVLPEKPITSGASAATGLSFRRGTLFHHNVEVEAQRAKDGLVKFLDFIKLFPNPYIIGHNIKNFDVPILLFHLDQHDLLSEFETSVCGFLDTLPISRSLFSKEEVNGSYSQQSLVKSLINKNYAAHDALQDVSALQELFMKKIYNENELEKFLFYSSYYKCKDSLQPLVAQKVISQNLMKKLAEASLGLSHLAVIHRRDTVNGIKSIFKKCKFCIRSDVVNKLAHYFDSEL